MGSGVVAIFITLYILILGCQASAYSYFAGFINNEIRPYFAAHGMQSEYNDAYQVFVYLVVSDVLLWTSFLSYVALLITGNGLGRSGSPGTFTNLVLCMAVTIITLACLSAKQTWSWWEFFSAKGLDHLAANCQGLAGMIIASLALSAFILITAFVLICCGGGAYMLSER
ncbi:hypothetical protein F5Y04DRAFT_289317 [Hypomontagnella monticulosa]|nr:hypothetical protein F5Y04DRAFT_289317 [Hypomontagnella monticulosa]